MWQDQKPDECVSTTKVPKKDKFKNNGVRKAFKNPLVPKRPLSAFFLYVRDKRAEVCEASPNLSSKEVAMELGKCGLALEKMIKLLISWKPQSIGKDSKRT